MEETTIRIEENKQQLIFLDTETTGFELTARIIELGYIITDNVGRTIKEMNNLIKLPDGIYIKNTHIHGISNEMCNTKGVNMVDILDRLNNDMNKDDILICHNVNFDRKRLLYECNLYNRIELYDKINNIKTEDTMIIGKNYFKEKRNIKLLKLYKMLYNEEKEEQHRALYDAIICKMCYFKMK
jgi:DNA polymerase III epsilon subunit-like protein